MRNDCLGSGCSRRAGRFGGCSCVGMIGIVQTGQPVLNDLRGGPGSGFGGLLVGDNFGCGCLRFGGRSPLGQVLLGLDGQRRRCACDDQDLLKPVEVGGRMDSMVPTASPRG